MLTRLWLLVVFTALFSACSFTPVKLAQTPVEESDFRLPPEALKEKFPDVEGLYLPNTAEYQEKLRRDSADTRVGNIERSTYVEALGEPQQTIPYRRGVLDFVGWPGPVTFAALSAFGPGIATGVVLAATTTGYLLADYGEEMVWQKGDYEIHAHRRPYGNPMLSHWEWFYQPEQGQAAQALMSYYPSQRYAGFNFSGRRSFSDESLAPGMFLSWFVGYTFHPAFLVDNLSVELQSSIQSIKDNRFYIIDLSQQMLTASASYNVNQGKQSLGLGVWYDNSLVTAYEEGYRGQIGLFAELGLLKKLTMEQVIRAGVFYGLDERAYAGPGLRVQWNMRIRRFVVGVK